MKTAGKMRHPLEETNRRRRRPALDRKEFAVRVLITLGLAMVTVAVAAALYLGIGAIFVVFLGVLLGVMLRGAADFVARRTGVKMRWALIIVIVALSGFVAMGAIYIVPQYLVQIGQVKESVVNAWPQVREQLGRTPLGAEIIARIPEPGALLSSASLLRHVRRAFSMTLFNISGLLVLAFVGVYMAVDPGLYIRGVTRLFPFRRRRAVRETLAVLGHTLRWWLLGTFTEMAFVAVLTSIALSIAGVPLAIGLGFLSGLLTFIPTIGLLISLIPAVVVSLAAKGVSAAVVTIVLYLIIHALDAYLIAPLVQRRAVHLPPVLTIVSLFTFGLAFGTIGLIVATPIAATLMVFIRTVYVENILGDHGSGAGERRAERAGENRGRDASERSRI